MLLRFHQLQRFGPGRWVAGSGLNFQVVNGAQRRLYSSVTSDLQPSSSRKRGLVAKGLRAAGIILAGGTALRLATDEGSRRSVEFWSTAFPIYLHYRWVEFRMKNQPSEVSDVEFDRLHDKYAPIAEALTLKMKGFYLKNAQTVSTMDDFLPHQYMSWCKKMQDQVPTELAPGQAQQIIEKSFGKPLEEIFSEFDEKPCGSASIGQVHRARLRSNGMEVAVKVQMPGIEQKFRSDIKTIQDFVWLAMPQHVTPMEEIEKQFVTEFDYIGEANNLKEIYDNIMPVYGDKVVIPKPVSNLCTKDVLVMEFLKGEKLIDGVKAHFKKYAELQGKSYEEIEKEQIELMKRPDFKFADLDEENAKMKKYQKIMDAKVSGVNFLKGCYNYTLGFFLSPMEYTERDFLLNLPGIVETLANVHGYEIMINGAFNGDPHPGNIMILDDGRLGLVDYGQVKRICQTHRLGYAKLILALAKEDVDETWKVLQELGVRSKYQNKDIQYKLTKFWNDNNAKEVTGGRNLQQFIDWIEEQDPAKDIPEDLVMPGRVSFLLRAIGNAFGIDLSMAKLWKPIALKALEDADAGKSPSSSASGRKEALHRRYSSIVHRNKWS